jgi:hypothetical protein
VKLHSKWKVVLHLIAVTAVTYHTHLKATYTSQRHAWAVPYASYFICEGPAQSTAHDLTQIVVAVHHL